MSSTANTPIEHRVAELLATLSKRPVEEIRPEAVLIDDLGIDSIQFLELFAMIEEEFGFELDVDDLRPELFRSVQGVVQFVTGRDSV